MRSKSSSKAGGTCSTRLQLVQPAQRLDAGNRRLGVANVFDFSRLITGPGIQSRDETRADYDRMRQKAYEDGRFRLEPQELIDAGDNVLAFIRSSGRLTLRDTARAMSQENVELVRSLYRAWDAGDRDAALRLADPEVVIDATRRVFNPGTYVGMEGIRRWWADVHEIWQEFRTEGLEFIDAGDRVVVAGRLAGKGKGSGVEVTQPVASVWTLRAGRVIRWEMGYAGRNEALEAVGLSEQDAHADS